MSAESETENSKGKDMTKTTTPTATDVVYAVLVNGRASRDEHAYGTPEWHHWQVRVEAFEDVAFAISLPEQWPVIVAAAVANEAAEDAAYVAKYGQLDAALDRAVEPVTLDRALNGIDVVFPDAA